MRIGYFQVVVIAISLSNGCALEAFAQTSPSTPSVPSQSIPAAVTQNVATAKNQSQYQLPSGEKNQLDINPIAVEAKNNELKHDLEIRNLGNTPIIIQAKPTIQVNAFEAMSTVKTKELIVIPAIKLLKAGETQSFRAFIRQPSTSKKIYRIFFQEVLPKPKFIPNADGGRNTVSNVRVGMQFGIPIYYNYSHEEILNIREERYRKQDVANTSVNVAQKTLGNVMNDVRNSQTAQQ
jgi:hypothetical protein